MLDFEEPEDFDETAKEENCDTCRFSKAFGGSLRCRRFPPLMLIKKLIKCLTYNKRKKRIEDKIFQRILKKYPDAEFYSRNSGEINLDYELIIKYVKLFDGKTGKFIKTKKYIVLRFSLDRNNSFYFTLFLFDKNGKLHYNESFSSYFGESFTSKWIKDYFI